jgi:hypothetical protein
LLGDLVDKVFGGSSELLLVRLLEQQRLSPKERALLESILADARADAAPQSPPQPKTHQEPRP